jgi:hypothetical protein
MSLTYGYELRENDDILDPAHKTGEMMSRLALPGAALVNHLPFCTNPTFHDQPHISWLSTVRHLPSWVPWFKYEPMAGICRDLTQRMINEPIDFVKNAMVRDDGMDDIHLDQWDCSEKAPLSRLWQANISRRQRN